MAGEEGETRGETVVIPPPSSEVPEKKEIIETAEEKKDEEKKTPAEEESTLDTSMKKKKGGPVYKKDFVSDVVYLYQFNRCPQLPSISPYCLKTETWIKLNDIKYENVDHKSKLRSKRGLLPFIEFNGEEVADSDIIIKTLSKRFEKDMDEGMTPEQRNVQHAMLAMVDNHLLWLISQWKTRHIDNVIKGYKLNLQAMSGYKFPNALLAFAFKHTFLRKTIRKVKATGLGEYGNEELDAMGKNDLKVLSDLLGEKEFFFGDSPRTLDLNAFIQLSMLLCVDKEVTCPMRDYLESECANLVGLFNRMKDRCWGDHWDIATGESLEMNPHMPKPVPVVEEEAKPEINDNKKEEEKEKADDEKKDEKEKEDESKEKEDNKEKSEQDEKEKEENKESEEKK